MELVANETHALRTLLRGAAVARRSIPVVLNFWTFFSLPVFIQVLLKHMKMSEIAFVDEISFIAYCEIIGRKRITGSLLICFDFIQ